MVKRLFQLFIFGALLTTFSAYADAPKTTTTVTTMQTTPSGQVIEKRQIITTAPAPKENIVTPTGYVNCFMVKAGWYFDSWIAEHSVCQYTNSPEGLTWVQGYWACDKYDLGEGKCTNWDWKAAHWTKTFNVY